MKFSKIKLTTLSANEICSKELDAVRGGNYCGCSCKGSSSSSDNQNANYANNYHSTSGCNQYYRSDTNSGYDGNCDASVPW